jgi:hypothetical protein
MGFDLGSIGSLAGAAIGFGLGGPPGAALGMGLGGAAGNLLGGAQDPIKVNVNPTIANQEARKKKIDEILAQYSAPGAATQTSGFSPYQMQSVKELQGIYGNLNQGPVVTQQMVENAQGSNLANAYSLAASAPGSVNPALAQRQAMDQIAQGNQKILEQSLPSALQEQNQNLAQQIATQQAIGQQSSQGRAQDLQYEQMKNQLIQQYLSMGFSQDQAQMQANLDAARIQAGVQGQNASTNSGLLGGLLGAAGQIGAAGISNGWFGGGSNPTVSTMAQPSNSFGGTASITPYRFDVNG